MTFKMTFACALAAAALAPSAFAETFSGPRIGLEAGYEDYSQEVDGAVYGIFAGWDFAVSEHWIVGVEGRLAEPDASFRFVRDTSAATAVSAVDLNEQYGFGARIGRVFGDKTLVFGQVGQEYFEVDATITTTPKAPCTQCATTINDFSFDEEMLTVAGGVERALNQNIRARIVYTYGDSDSYDRHRVAFGLAYQF
jgi:outer membrane immunogenic protein